MNRYDNKYLIEEVLDRKTNMRCKDWGYRVGRNCFIVLCEPNHSLIVEYPNGATFSTSKVIEKQQNGNKLRVITMNRIYDFKLV